MAQRLRSQSAVERPGCAALLLFPQGAAESLLPRAHAAIGPPNPRLPAALQTSAAGVPSPLGRRVVAKRGGQPRQQPRREVAGKLRPCVLPKDTSE